MLNQSLTLPKSLPQSFGSLRHPHSHTLLVLKCLLIHGTSPSKQMVQKRARTLLWRPCHTHSIHRQLKEADAAMQVGARRTSYLKQQ